MSSGKRGAGTGPSETEGYRQACTTRMRFYTLSVVTLLILLLVACGREEERSERVAETTGVEEETTEAEETTEPTEDQREVEEQTEESRAEVASAEQAPPKAPVAPAKEIPPPTPAPPAQPEPPTTGISVTQTAMPTSVAVGQPVTFTATVKNNVTTQRAALKNFLPPGLSLVSATPSQGFCGTSHHGDNLAECSLGVIPSGSSATVAIVATPTVPGSMTNTVVIQAEFSPATSASTASTSITAGPGSNTGAPHKAH